MNTVPIFFTFDERYVLPAAVAFQSLLENANQQNFYKLYVLTFERSINERSKCRLEEIVNQFPNASLAFKNVDPGISSCWEDAHKGRGHYSREILLKLAPASLFPDYDVILCSDVDVVFSGDVSQALEYCLDNFYIAGVQGIEKMEKFIDRQHYPVELKNALKKGVGGGFLLYNLKKIRDDDMEPKLFEALALHVGTISQPEQDILNIVFEDYILHIDIRYMFCTYMYNLFRDQEYRVSLNWYWFHYLKKKYMENIKADRNYTVKQIQESFEYPIQIHYATKIKPWNTLFCFRKLIWYRYLYRSGFLFQHILTNEPVNFLRFVFAVRLFRRIYRRMLRTVASPAK